MTYFEVVPNNSIYQGELLYRTSEYSFDFAFLPECRRGVNQSSSLSIDTLQISVDPETNRCISVWGYHPLLEEHYATLTPPTAIPGSLFVLGTTFEIGMGHPLEERGDYPTHYDVQNGWICIGDPNFPPNGRGIEFATNVMAVIYKARLLSLWLHPTFSD